jgi:hypothetical protein
VKVTGEPAVTVAPLAGFSDAFSTARLATLAPAQIAHGGGVVVPSVGLTEPMTTHPNTPSATSRQITDRLILTPAMNGTTSDQLRNRIITCTGP